MSIHEERVRSAEQALSILEDLNEVAKAAGRIPYDLKQLKTMTLFDFLINDAAPNHIRFVYNPPDPPDDDVPF